VDVLLIETCQDILQAKAAVVGARRAMADEGRSVPVVVQVTVETTGTMLLGSEIGAALTALEPLGIDLIGLNARLRTAPTAAESRSAATALVTAASADGPGRGSSGPPSPGRR